MDKYLGATTLLPWLRMSTFEQGRASPFWKGLLSASPVILHWLRWKPGSGAEIALGRDKILGLDHLSILSPQLRSLLSSQNFFFLAQMKGTANAPHLPDHWLHSSTLQLQGSMALEWEAYTTALKSVGISLRNSRDILLWAGGDGSGTLTVKNTYEALFHTQPIVADPPWLHRIWKWHIPLKILLFFWLCVKDKALTWEALRRRGWQGPGICPLCNQASEDIHHLLIHCNFTSLIWHLLSQQFSIPLVWNGNTITDCLSSWFSDRHAPHSLAAHVCWQTWIERNHVIFEGRTPSCQAVLHRVLSSFTWQLPTDKSLHLKACDHSLVAGGTLVCFNGAARSTGLCCGAGGTFKTHSSRITNWYLNCGSGSNNKAELMGLWVSLYLASCCSLSHLLVLGDSRVIIDWINHVGQLQSIHLEGWKQRTLELASQFTDAHFQHIPRYHNTEADALSKRALSAVPGRLSIYHIDNGIASSISSINLFET